MMTDYDVLIVGGGLAGSALAAGLAKTRLRIAMVDAGPMHASVERVEDDSVMAYDARVSALTQASQEYLDSIGVWSEILKTRVCAYTDMRVWDADGTGSVHFDSASVKASALGHIVENRFVNAALLSAVEGRTKLFRNAPVKALHRRNSHTFVELESGESISATLLIAADGANSRIRQWADFKTREWPYGHKAIACTVESEHSHQHTAWQRFLPSGPLAFLPLAGGNESMCSIVWSADTARADELLTLDDQAFMAELGRCFEHRLGQVQNVSKRFGFPLTQRHAVDYVQRGIALVGDAAHSIHPLAGQGINLGFADVAVLVEEIERALAANQDFASMKVLSRYQRRRKGDNLAMMASMEGFKRLFERDELPLRWLRNTGLKLVDSAPPLKQILVKRAMGF